MCLSDNSGGPNESVCKKLWLSHLPVKVEGSNFCIMSLEVSEVEVVLEGLLLPREPEKGRETLSYLWDTFYW